MHIHRFELFIGHAWYKHFYIVNLLDLSLNDQRSVNGRKTGVLLAFLNLQLHLDVTTIIR
ncbi:MAG: hypothetical protein ACI82A_003433 [Candidatus Azotimanducaceae bacterium]|jgi:hypothetical protein